METQVVGKYLFRGAALVLAGLILGAAAWTPIIFESQSLYYKFGLEKNLLQAGKSLGWLALALMVGQVILASRFVFIERRIPLKLLMVLHRGGGILIGILILVHPLLILWADGFSLFPLEWRYWPEFLGGFTAFFVAAIVVVSMFRARFNIGYKHWQHVHRLCTPTAVILVFIHAYFVSETFHHFVPRTGLFLLAGIGLAVFAGIYIKRGAGLRKAGGNGEKK
jgi:predicted ferric reductase